MSGDDGNALCSLSHPLIAAVQSPPPSFGGSRATYLAPRPRHVLVGTEAAGIFESTDGGQTWAKIEFSDYFIRSISNFFFDRDRVIVATYGNGLWKLLPGSFPPPVLCDNFPAPCRIDVRKIMGDRIYPRWACPHPPDLPTCHVYGLEKGIIENLTLSEEGALKALAVNEGKLEAWDIDGERIDPSLPVKPTTATRPGEFSGCPGILAEGGSITGFIYAEDQGTAVIGRFADKPPSNKTGLATLPFVGLRVYCIISPPFPGLAWREAPISGGTDHSPSVFAPSCSLFREKAGADSPKLRYHDQRGATGGNGISTYNRYSYEATGLYRFVKRGLANRLLSSDQPRRCG